MKKIIVGFIISLTFVLSNMLISNVYAYEENTFTNGICISNNSYLTSASTGYSLSDETGTYSLSGKTYTEYQSLEKKDTYIFYIVSNDGKVLYALVPNYNSVIANNSIKSLLFNKGIVTTANCDNIYVMNKTVVGNTPSDSSYINFDNGSTNSNSNNNKTTNNTNSNKSRLDNSTSKLNSPNTASPMVWSAIMVSIVLVLVGGLSLYRKSKGK